MYGISVTGVQQFLIEEEMVCIVLNGTIVDVFCLLLCVCWVKRT